MFHWWYIPLGLLALPLLGVAALLCFMRYMMPWKNCCSILIGLKVKLPKVLESHARGLHRSNITVPDVLTMADGTKVTTPEQFEKRREEMLSLFERYVYGTFPRSGYTTEFTVLEEGEALGGVALRRQVKITVRTEKGASDALMLLYLPRGEQPAPVILGLNSRGNHAVSAEEAVLPSFSFDTQDGKWKESRGKFAYRWNIADSVSRGYAVATIFSSDFAPDSGKTFRDRVVGLFYEPDFRTISAWAFGLHRAVDYLVSCPEVDGSHIAVVGHSRLGKAAIWAGANDRRIGLVISNDSGNSGASLSRDNHGETVRTINAAFPHWFTPAYGQFGNKVNELPVDQHMLLASIAPRKVYVANGWMDLWSDPQGAFQSLQAAKSAFALFYGDQVLPDNMSTYLPVGEAWFCPSMGIHIREGGHEMLPQDWVHYLDYMDRYFRS